MRGTFAAPDLCSDQRRSIKTRESAGGVAVSGLEITQNNLRLSLTRDGLNERLRDIMSDIHERCVEHGAGGGEYVDYLKGANIAGIKKVADAVLKCGVF